MSIDVTERREELVFSTWRGFVRAQSALIKELDAHLIHQHNISLSSFEVLLFLQDAQEHRMQMSDLADSVLLTRSGLTRLVDRLEAQKLITRQQSSVDGRASFAVITPQGLRMAKKVRRTEKGWILELFQALSEEELGLLSSVWERILPGATA
jgi:DNA-binding MarR family transcriptional regulator